MYAYFLPRVDPLNASGHPLRRRIDHVGPWQTSDYRGGTALTWKGQPPFRPEDYGTPVDIGDGVQFFPPKVWPSPRAFQRETMPPGMPWRMVPGVELHVPRAEAAPAFLAWGADGASSIGAPAQEWARLAWQAWDMREHTPTGTRMTAPDSLLSLLVLRALQASYRLTEEALSAAGWITTADLSPILAILWGLDPKAVRLAAATSNPAPQDGPASRDLLPLSGTTSCAGGAPLAVPPSSECDP